MVVAELGSSTVTTTGGAGRLSRVIGESGDSSCDNSEFKDGVKPSHDDASVLGVSLTVVDAAAATGGVGRVLQRINGLNVAVSDVKNDEADGFPSRCSCWKYNCC